MARAAAVHRLISPYLLHHDARYFPDPETFDPDRWTPGARTGAA
jgi:pentalenene oxygenase